MNGLRTINLMLNVYSNIDFNRLVEKRRHLSSLFSSTTLIRPSIFLLDVLEFFELFSSSIGSQSTPNPQYFPLLLSFPFSPSLFSSHSVSFTLIDEIPRDISLFLLFSPLFILILTLPFSPILRNCYRHVYIRPLVIVVRASDKKCRDR